MWEILSKLRMLLSLRKWKKNLKSSRTFKIFPHYYFDTCIRLLFVLAKQGYKPIDFKQIFEEKGTTKFSLKEEALSVLKEDFKSSQLQDTYYQNVHFASTVSSI